MHANVDGRNISVLWTGAYMADDAALPPSVYHTHRKGDKLGSRGTSVSAHSHLKTRPNYNTTASPPAPLRLLPTQAALHDIGKGYSSGWWRAHCAQ